MGCDGGTIPKRDELVRTRKKPEQVRVHLPILIQSRVHISTLSNILFKYADKLNKSLVKTLK